MNSLVFLADDLQSPSKRNKARIKATYLGVGIVKGKLYRNAREALIAEADNRPSGNTVVYGSLYHVENFEHFVLPLDALHDCSLSLIGREHILDLQHRVQRDIVMINFTSITDLLKLKYNETVTVQAQIYLANIKHPKIAKKITRKNGTYRVQSGMRPALLEQWEEHNG